MMLMENEPCGTLSGGVTRVVSIQSLDTLAVQITDPAIDRDGTATYEVQVGLTPTSLGTHPDGAKTIGTSATMIQLDDVTNFGYARVTCTADGVTGGGGEVGVWMNGAIRR